AVPLAQAPLGDALVKLLLGVPVFLGISILCAARADRAFVGDQLRRLLSRNDTVSEVKDP
ncbi:MAG: hypothetical protein ACRDFW_05300, partial [bacterium]